jgi:hypothetical protein
MKLGAFAELATAGRCLFFAVTVETWLAFDKNIEGYPAITSNNQ